MKTTKTIWMFWETGLAGAPEVVHLAKKSWEALNPDYTLIFLDHSTIRSYVDLDTSLPGWQRLPVQKRANLLRLELLLAHGGIWADATLICVSPIERWLPQELPTGFFAFRKATGQKLVSNFFIASSGDHYFVRRWRDSYRRYMRTIPQPMPKNLYSKLLKAFPFLNTPFGSVLFTLPVVRDRWGFPYFIMHYLGNRLILGSSAARKIWEGAPQVDYLSISDLMRSTDAEAALEKVLENGRPPAIKLSHHLDPQANDRFGKVIRRIDRSLDEWAESKP